MANPFRIAGKIDDGPYIRAVLMVCVEDSVRKNSAHEPMVIAVNDAVRASRDLEAIDIIAEAGKEVVAETWFLCFVNE